MPNDLPKIFQQDFGVLLPVENLTINIPIQGGTLTLKTSRNAGQGRGG